MEYNKYGQKKVRMDLSPEAIKVVQDEMKRSSICFSKAVNNILVSHGGCNNDRQIQCFAL